MREGGWISIPRNNSNHRNDSDSLHGGKYNATSSILRKAELLLKQKTAHIGAVVTKEVQKAFSAGSVYPELLRVVSTPVGTACLCDDVKKYGHSDWIQTC